MPNDFTPLSHQELRELWNSHKACIGCDDICKAILSAIWWEAMEEQAEFYQYHHKDRSYCRECSVKRDDRHGRLNHDWFLAKLAEIGIDWREDEAK